MVIPVSETDGLRYQRYQKKAVYKYPELVESSIFGNLWSVFDSSSNVPKVDVRILIRYLDFFTGN
jgi:hypothetical protein